MQPIFIFISLVAGVVTFNPYSDYRKACNDFVNSSANNNQKKVVVIRDDGNDEPGKHFVVCGSSFTYQPNTPAAYTDFNIQVQ